MVIGWRGRYGGTRLGFGGVNWGEGRGERGTRLKISDLYGIVWDLYDTWVT
jgi:hypothetical protein